MAVRGKKRGAAHGAQRRLPQDVWARLYADFYPQIERYFTTRRVQRADAEDLAMQVFAELAQRKAPMDPEPYIRAIARNMLSRYRRNKVKESAGLHGLLAEAAAKDGTGYLSGQERSEASYRDTVEAIAARLSARQLEMVRLRFADNLSIAKIAVRLGCSKPAVYKRIQRLRKRVTQGIPWRRGRAPARARSGRGGPCVPARAAPGRWS